MQLHRLLAAATLAGLAGACATPADLAAKPPVLEYDSPRAPKEIASCIAEKWSTRTAYISALPKGDGYVVILLHQSAGADATAFIEPRGPGSHVRYAERIPELSPAWMSAAATDCR